MCAEDRKPAKKTCMKCEISMCVQHLQAHLTTPVLLQTHPLTEPMALCGNTKCSQHGKLLEYYCLDDMTCVCVSCAIEDQHRLHNMKTFSTAHKELVEKLKAEQQILQEKTDNENVSLEKWEKSEREKLGRCSVRLIEAVTNLRDISLTSVQSSVSARMVSLKTSKSSTEGEGHFQIPADFWGSLLTLVDPEHHQELIPTDSHWIFEPQSLGPGMSLSKDKRKVFHNSWLGQCCATLLICCTKTASSYQRWVVSLSEESDWMIGLCDKKCAKNLKDGAVYGLCWEDKQLSSLTTKRNEGSQSSTSQGLKVQNTGTVKTGTQLVTTSALITYQPATPPEKVEVLWNFAASTLSFFRRTGQHQREEIITMKLKVSINNWNLVPFVQLGKQNIHSTTQQQQWKCSCGKVYYWDGNRYRDHSSGYPHQSVCSCGKALSVTEVVCKLC
ncbi:unnamed protein product [Oreochromis niloticus]|nr:unnamed protein product [Mustela putorius furo]